MTPSSDPALSSSVSELLKQAAATAYCRPALRALGSALRADDVILIAALNQAAEERNAKAFSNLYCTALLVNRRIPAELLELGAALLPDAMLLLRTALLLEGDVASALATAVQSGRMGREREAFAIIVGWLDYERRGISAPPEFFTLTRKLCRVTMRSGMRSVRLYLVIVAKLSGDPVIASILNADITNDTSLDVLLAEVRKCASGLDWQLSIPVSPELESTLGGGATLKRAIPKARRNDPCPCGSGRKFKQCCEGKITIADQYEIDGVTVSEATAHPELLLTVPQIMELRSYELHALDPKLLTTTLAAIVATRLVFFGEISRAIEVLKAIGPEQVPVNTLDAIAFDFFIARKIDALRWLIDWAAGSVNVTFDMEILLAPPTERLQMLQAKAREAFEAERAGDSSASMIFQDIGHGALCADPALGILIARGVLPASGWANQSTLLEDIEDNRDILGLDDNEPAYDILDASDQASLDQARHAIDLEKVRVETTTRVSQRDAEIQRLKSQIDAMQASLTQREKAIQEVKVASKEKPTLTNPAPASQDSAETRELRDQLRRLKEHLKVEHDERNSAMRELRAAQDQLRRATREKSENPATGTLPASEPDADESMTMDVVLDRQILRIPEYSSAFRESLKNHPRQASAAALAMAARLACGDASVWKTIRALKMRPGTLRARVAGNYRLLFEIGPGDSLRMVDFILRRDLERWLAAAGR